MVTQLERSKVRGETQNGGTKARSICSPLANKKGIGTDNSGNIEVVRNLFDEMACGERWPARPTGGCLEQFWALFDAVKTVFCDYRVNLYSLVSNSDSVTACYYVVGSKKDARFQGSPAPEVTISGIDIFRIKNGQVIGYLDINHQMKIGPEIRRSVTVV